MSYLDDADWKARHGTVQEVLDQNAKLREELEAVTKERDEALERIKASQEQESIALPEFMKKWRTLDDDCLHIMFFRWKDRDLFEQTISKKLYTEPVIPPTEAELQSQLAAASSRIAVLESANIRQEEAGPGWAGLDSVQMS